MRPFRLSPEAPRGLGLHLPRQYPGGCPGSLPDPGRLPALAQHPNSRHRRGDLTTRDDVLFWPVYSYLVIYRPDTEPLEILRVLHGNRDVTRILG